MTVEVCYTINPWIMLTLGPRRADGSLCTAVAKAIILPLWGYEGHRPAGVFWLLEEEILHKERRDFVRRQNRGVRKICRGRKTKVSRPLFFHILAEGGDVIDGRIVDIMLELAEV